MRRTPFISSDSFFPRDNIIWNVSGTCGSFSNMLYILGHFWLTNSFVVDLLCTGSVPSGDGWSCRDPGAAEAEIWPHFLHRQQHSGQSGDGGCSSSPHTSDPGAGREEPLLHRQELWHHCCMSVSLKVKCSTKMLPLCELLESCKLPAATTSDYGYSGWVLDHQQWSVTVCWAFWVLIQNKCVSQRFNKHYFTLPIQSRHMGKVCELWPDVHRSRLYPVWTLHPEPSCRRDQQEHQGWFRVQILVCSL